MINFSSLLGRKPLALALGAILALSLPWWAGNQYQLHLAALICVYWILISGLNLVIGYTGQLSIGHVGLLSIGAYAFSILAGKMGVPPALALVLAGALGGICGLALGLPSLRLPGFYFAMTTMAFALIVNELVLAQGDLTGGGIGLSGPLFSPPMDSPKGFYYLAAGMALLVTWLSWNIVRRIWGLGLMAIRDNPVAAQGVGVPLFRVKLMVFVFSGITAGVAGAMFASLQSYITPDTFVFELSLFFFVCIVIGGRGSMIGPFIGTVILTLIPELVAPLAKLGHFFYGLLLLVVVLVVPEGLGRVFEVLIERFRPPPVRHEDIKPDLSRLSRAIKEQA
jgi:branched-chain amino acid transport system permease protein